MTKTATKIKTAPVSAGTLTRGLTHLLARDERGLSMDVTPGCQVGDCERPRRYIKSGLCSMHHDRVYEHGSTDPRPEWRRKHTGCSIAGCEGTHKARGLCGAHHLKLLKYGDPEHVVRRRNVCQEEGCERLVSAHRLCERHVRDAMAERDLSKHPWLTKLGRTSPTVGASYSSVHYRLLATRGAARLYGCIACGAAAEQWSYDHGDPRAEIDGKTGLPFTTDLRHYQPLCIPCHVDRDQSQARSMRLPDLRPPRELRARVYQADAGLTRGAMLMSPQSSPFRALIRTCETCHLVLSTAPADLVKAYAPRQKDCPRCRRRRNRKLAERRKATHPDMRDERGKDGS